MVVSLVGYFTYITAAFTLIMALLISLLKDSTLQSVHHYQRPLIVASVTVETKAHWHTASATKAKPIQRAEGSPVIATASIPTIIAAAPTAKAAAEKTTRQKLAHVHKPKVLARARDHSNGPDYPVALGYAEDPRYGPSSFSKLPYLIQHGRRRR